MGGWFSMFSSTNSNNPVSNSKKNINNPVSNSKKNINNPVSNQGKYKYESEIFKKIKNIYVQIHAVSCANTIEKVFGKGQSEKSKYAANSGISYVGVQQCLQVSDYFSKNPIESGNLAINNSKNIGNVKTNLEPPGNLVNNNHLLIFCCSELTRTHQTLFLSWIRYLKNYREKKGKIIVIPWLNEVSLPSKFGYSINKDNFPSSLAETKNAWKKFIENLKRNKEKIEADTLNLNSSLNKDIDDIGNCESWDELFYLSSLIFKVGVQDPLSNKGKETPIERIWIHKKRMGDMNQFIKLFHKILAKYIIDQGINLDEYDGIELVIVAHHNSAEHFMEFVMPSTHAQFKEIQLVNCEVVRLPGQCLQNFVTKMPTQEPIVRVFPMNFNSIKNGTGKNSGLTMLIGGKKVYSLFILYIAALDLFLSVNYIVKAEGTNERVQIEKPLILFLSSSISDYRKQLEEMQKYIQRIEADYGGKPGPTFYNYAEMLAKINAKREKISQYLMFKKREDGKQPQKHLRMGNSFFNSTPIQQYIENKTKLDETIPEKNRNKIIATRAQIHTKLKNYLFDFCELTPEIVDSIAVF